MKTEGQIRHKLQQVTYRHLQRTVRKALSRRPENCVYNGLVKLPLGDVRYCNLIETQDGSKVPCDEAFGGMDQCAKCADYLCGNTKEKVQASFTSFLKTSDVASIAARYPDVAALLWALDMATLGVPSEDPDPVPAPLPSVTMLYLQPEGNAVSHTTPTSTGHFRAMLFPLTTHPGQ